MKCRHCGAPWEFEWEYCPRCNRNRGGAEYPAVQTAAELLDVERLIRRIQEAFTEVELGGGETIHQAYLEGAYNRVETWLAAREKDPETRWTDVPDWKLESLSSTLSFFDIEGWRFHLPAFMCWSLRNWRTNDSITPYSVIWSLTFTEFTREVRERFESLNQSQSEAVLAFLEFFHEYSGDDHADAAEAVQSYWRRFQKN